mmetsp:Transcript_78612/g.155723  ORF Transcript_78612/g.155723 Transcript_78612/m.155723 type:complete len:148 (+) Transcript_78612:3-446(+)
MLETVLCPGGGGCTNKPSAPNLNTSVMLVNVSPAASIEKRTINSLRYGQIFAGTGAVVADANCSRNITKENRFFRVSNASTPPLSKEELQRVTSDIQDIYKQHCPERTEAEVNEVLVKFKGREKELLSKIRFKYVPNSAMVLQSHQP